MRRNFFWLLTALVLGLACHIAYLLFIPSRTLASAFDRALENVPANTFQILEPATQVRLMPFAAEQHIVGICKFDLSKGPVKLTAQMPEGFWTLAVYTLRGRQVYAINDTQADTNVFTVELYKSGGLLSELLGGQDDGQDVDTDELGWRITLTEREGVALLWLAVGDALLKREAIAVMEKSRCLRLDG